MANTKTETKKNTRTIMLSGLLLMSMAIITSSTLLLLDPAGLDVQRLIASLLTVLLLGGLATGYPIASKDSSKSMAIAGTISLAILFTFVGFFIVAAVGYLSALLKV